MGWASRFIADLKAGKAVEFRPRGNSMTGLVDSGDLVRVVPINERKPKEGDIVLCKVHGSEYLHKVLAVRGEQYQIGNNKGHINGWAHSNAVYGTCVRVEGRNR